MGAAQIVMIEPGEGLRILMHQIAANCFGKTHKIESFPTLVHAADHILDTQPQLICFGDCSDENADFDGFEIIEWIRDQAQLSNSMILLQVQDNVRRAEELLHAGVVDMFLERPFTLRNFAVRVRALLNAQIRSHSSQIAPQRSLDIAIICRPADFTQAHSLRRALEAHALNVWLEETADIDEHAQQVRREAVSKAKRVLAIWSDNAAWDEVQVETAMRGGDRLMNIRVGAADLPTGFRRFTRVQAADIWSLSSQGLILDITERLSWNTP